MTQRIRPLHLISLAALLGGGCQAVNSVLRNERAQLPSVPAEAAPDAPSPSLPPPEVAAAVVDDDKPYRASHNLDDSRAHEASCNAMRRPDDAMTPAEKTIDRTTRALFDCAESPPVASIGWILEHLDAAGEPSQLLRAGYVLECLHPERFEVEGARPLSVAKQYMACGHDARALDPGKLAAELAAMKLSPDLQRIGRAQVKELHALSQRLVDAYTRLGPDYKRILIDAPDEAWTSWQALRDGHKQALADAAAVELAYDTGVKSKLAGCRPKLLAHFQAYVAERKPSSVEEAKALASDSVGARLLGALAACDAAQGRWSVAVHELHLSSRGNLRVGPRAEALAAAHAALEAVRADQTKFPMELESDSWEAPAPAQDYSDHRRYQVGKALEGTTRIVADETSTIKSVTPAGEHVILAFVTVKERVADQDCRTTNRVERIAPDGRVEYQQVCRVVGSHIEEHTLTSVAVRAELAAGLKPGATVTLAIDTQNKVGETPEAEPLSVTAPGGKNVVATYGIPLR